MDLPADHGQGRTTVSTATSSDHWRPAVPSPVATAWGSLMPQPNRKVFGSLVGARVLLGCGTVVGRRCLPNVY